MNWYIGQEIVCVKSHSKGVVKEGAIYTIKALKQGCCYVLVDVGIKHQDFNESGLYYMLCAHCNKTDKPTTDNTWWLSEILFAPLGDISELQEILKEQPNIITK